MIPELTIVASRRAHLNTLRHLCRDLRGGHPGLRLVCRCPADLVTEIAASVGPAVDLARLPESPALELRRRLHTFLFMLLAAEGFSPFFRRRVSAALAGKKLQSFVLRIGRRLAPRLEGPSLNRFLTRVVSAFSWHRTFPTRRVVVISKCSTPHLLCNRRHDVVTVLDGWDHPTTSPAGYRTRAIAAWNDDLAADWEEMQGADRVIGGYPYRFAYLGRAQRVVAPVGRPKLLYAMATFPSKSALDQRRHEEEMAVVRQLQAWLRPHVASFEVKPHPIGPAGHLELLVEACPGITVHPYEESGASTYDLTDGYNRARRRTLASVDLVLGIWTTFLLDAAVAGKAIALIELPADSPFEALLTAQLGLHVHHLRDRVNAVIDLQAAGPSFGGDASSFESFVDRAVTSGQRVADWVVPAATSESLVTALLDENL